MLFIQYEAKCYTGGVVKTRFFLVDVHMAAVSGDAMLEAICSSRCEDFDFVEIVGARVLESEPHWSHLACAEASRVLSTHFFRNPVKFSRLRHQYERVAT